MEELVNKLINAKEKEELQQIIENQLEKIKTIEKESFQRQLTKKAKHKQEELEKQNSYLDRNIVIHEKETSIQAIILEEIILAGKHRESIEKVITKIKDKILKIKENNTKEVNVEIIKKVIEILQREYQFINILKVTKTKIYILLGREIEGDYLEIKKHHFILSIYDTKKEDETIFVLKQFGKIINQMLVGNSKTVPDSFIELCKQNGIELREEKEEKIAMFAQLFALATIIKLEKSAKEQNKEVIEYYENIIKSLYLENNKKEKK